MKDWTGNSKAVFIPNGDSSHSNEEREVNDYYATDPKALEMLLERETFFPYIWEPACGGGHLSKVLTEHGYKVRSSDIVDRGYPNTEIIDFLQVKKDTYSKNYTRDIITNPPYKYAREFVKKALDISMDGTKVAMFLKLTFLEGQARRTLFSQYPPTKIYVFSQRQICAKNGDFTNTKSSAVAYAWFIWKKGFKGEPSIYWI